MDTLVAILSVLGVVVVVAGLLWLVGAHTAGAIILRYTLEPFARWFQRVFYGIDKPVVGPEALIGLTGRAISDFAPAKQSGFFEGRVQVGPETWRAQSAFPVTTGKAVRVVERQGLSLHVEPTQ